MRGSLNEDLIIAKLEQKCDIKREPTFDHVYKLDFIVDRFKNIDKLTHIGVQVTTNPIDTLKQRDFLRERKKKTLVDRSLYIKVAPNVDINSWGAELIYNAILAFTFQKSMREIDVLGVIINSDVTFDFFELDSASEESPSALKGTITHYVRDKGYGYIASATGTWFFNIRNIEDQRLTENFLPNAETDPGNKVVRPIYVEFEDEGITKPGVKYPNAVRVKLSSRS